MCIYVAKHIKFFPDISEFQMYHDKYSSSNKFLPRCDVACLTTAPVIIIRRSSILADKGWKYALYWTNTHEKKFCRIRSGDRGGHDIGLRMIKY
jgi:hypothetical protein